MSPAGSMVYVSAAAAGLCGWLLVAPLVLVIACVQRISRHRRPG